MPFLKKRRRSPKSPNALDKTLAVPVFCYHSVNITGTTYARNDHVALMEDLTILSRQGFRLLSPLSLVKALRGEGVLPQGKYACITFDDGADLDYYDYDHPDAGLVKSFQGILEQSSLGREANPDAALTASFVIVSPQAREELTTSCFFGQELIRDSWWRECAQKGMIGIANHSWDHTHETLTQVQQRENQKGSFYNIDTYQDADAQIRVAQDYLDRVVGDIAMPLFAYPYGHASPYLVEEYFPNFGSEHRQLAAFGLAPSPVTRNANIWNLPRYVCGKHWQSPEGFRKILEDCLL
jgi:Predicted xylanase/chitin deacetylase